MKEQLISFTVAKLAKEKGFDWGCSDCYSERGHLYSNGWCERLDDWFEDQDFFNSEIEKKKASEKYYTTPTQSLLQKWLREVHNIHIAILPKILPSNEIKYYCFKGKMKKDFEDLYDTYEEALEIGLYRALELI